MPLRQRQEVQKMLRQGGLRWPRSAPLRPLKASISLSYSRTATSGAALPNCIARSGFPSVAGTLCSGAARSRNRGCCAACTITTAKLTTGTAALGALRVGLLDLRCRSPTRGQGQVIELDQEVLRGIFIPAGVAHGFYAVTDAMLFYLVDSYYDGTDEWGLAWDDPDAGLDWGIEGVPVLSPRDQNNPRLRDIPAEDLPN